MAREGRLAFDARGAAPVLEPPVLAHVEHTAIKVRTRRIPEVLPHQNAGVVRVKHIEAGIVLLPRDAPDTTTIQHLKYKAMKLLPLWPLLVLLLLGFDVAQA